MGRQWKFFLVSTAFTTLCAGSATAAILHVTNYGVDAAGCSSDTKPCRSISRAIANANSGDTILVGPGIYGDINRDVDFADPGEEAAEPAGDDEGCVVCIRKAVRIISSHGAAATRIESRSNLGDAINGWRASLVLIAAEGVTFGTPGHGFELSGGPYTMLTVFRGDTHVSGNIARRSGTEDRDSDFPQQVGFAGGATTGGTVEFAANIAIGHHVGYSFFGSAPLVVRGNVAAGNTWEGFALSGSGQKSIIGNSAIENGAGPPMLLPGDGVLVYPSAAGFAFYAGNSIAEDNLSIGNYGPGFLIKAPGYNVRIENSAASGNAGPGVRASSFSVSNVKYNNIFGNLGNGNGCGVLNDSGKALNAAQNFWGAATGPGADPADKAGPGSGCDVGAGSGTRVAPFSTVAQPVVPPAG